jgi:hypothetical protein
MTRNVQATEFPVATVERFVYVVRGDAELMAQGKCSASARVGFKRVGSRADEDRNRAKSRWKQFFVPLSFWSIPGSRRRKPIPRLRHDSQLCALAR